MRMPRSRRLDLVMSARSKPGALEYVVLLTLSACGGAQKRRDISGRLENSQRTKKDNQKPSGKLSVFLPSVWTMLDPNLSERPPVIIPDSGLPRP